VFEYNEWINIIYLSTGFTKAIISLRSLLRFTFNPFGVGASQSPKPTPTF